MAVNTETLLALKLLLWQALGDYLTFATTTNIGDAKTITSTTLNTYDNASNNSFVGWWVYINGTENAGVARKVNTYATTGGVLTVYGANLDAEAAAVTCYLSRYNPDHVERALLRAIEEIYPTLYLPLNDQTLITGNILPDASFEDWSSSTALTWYTNSTGALAQTTTAGLFRNGLYSIKYTAAGADAYVYISSDTYPRLKDLQGQTVDFHCLVYPEVANDAWIQIYTIQADTTAQHLPYDYADELSTAGFDYTAIDSTSPAASWTALSAKGQKINTDLEEIQIRFGVHTNTKYVYFDDASLQGRNIKEYLLPIDFRKGRVSEVRMQNTSHQEPAFYDLNPFATMNSGDILEHDIVDLGNWRYLRLLSGFNKNRRLRLKGFKPLETMTSDTGTATLDEYRVPLLIAKAKEIFFGREGKPLSSEDTDRFARGKSEARREYYELKSRMGMSRPPESLRRRNID